ncbi:MAG: hypothetical protein QW472_05420 [Candidatus Aenigmatarchaeota archaeon]
MKKDLLDKIIFYFENAPYHAPANIDNVFLNKVKSFLLKLKPTRFWEKKGIINRKLKTNVYIDFIMLLENKLIACEVEKSNFNFKFNLFNGIKLFDEIWFFTNIPVEKTWLFYKLENNLKIKQRFFGVNEKGEIAEINLKSAQS